MKIIIDILSAIGTLSFFASLFTLRHMFKKDQLTKKTAIVLFTTIGITIITLLTLYIIRIYY